MRTGMTDLVQTVRELSNAGTNEMTVGTTVYWSDDHIQISLDNHRQDLQFQNMQSVPEQGAGSVLYKEFRTAPNLESGTVFYLQYAGGTVVGTALYSVDYTRGVINFTNDTRGTAFYVTARTYDVNAAAADIWRKKASNVANNVDWSSDNHSIKGNQVYSSYMKQAEYFQGLAHKESITIFRGDMR